MFHLWKMLAAANALSQSDPSQQSVPADHVGRASPTLANIPDAPPSPSKELLQQGATSAAPAGSLTSSSPQPPDVSSPVASDQPLSAYISDASALSAVKQQLQADLTDDLAASEAAADTALAAAAAASSAADPPYTAGGQRLRAQIPNNAVLNSPQGQQPADLTEDLAASEVAVDSALAAAAESLSNTGSTRVDAEQVLHRELADDLTASEAAVEAAVAAARDSLSSSPPDASKQSVQLGPGSGSPPMMATPTQLSVAVPSSDPPAMTGGLSAAAAQDSPEQAPAAEVAESSTSAIRQMPKDLPSIEQSASALPIRHSVTAAQDSAAIAVPSSSHSSPLAEAAAAAADDTSAAASQEADQAVAAVTHDSSLPESMAPAAAEDIAAAQEADKGPLPSGPGALPQSGLVSASGSSQDVGPAGAVAGLVAPPPSELNQELAADLKELQALRSQVRP